MKATLNQYESVVKYLVLITHLGAETSYTGMAAFGTYTTARFDLNLKNHIWQVKLRLFQLKIAKVKRKTLLLNST